MATKRITKQERLQAAWDQALILMEAAIEFRPFDGWYAVPMEARHFGDQGEWLGANSVEAMAQIEWLQPRQRKLA